MESELALAKELELLLRAKGTLFLVTGADNVEEHCVKILSDFGIALSGIAASAMAEVAFLLFPQAARLSTIKHSDITFPKTNGGVSGIRGL